MQHSVHDAVLHEGTDGELSTQIVPEQGIIFIEVIIAEEERNLAQQHSKMHLKSTL
jgi:hypothetical protein